MEEDRDRDRKENGEKPDVQRDPHKLWDSAKDIPADELEERSKNDKSEKQ